MTYQELLTAVRGHKGRIRAVVGNVSCPVTKTGRFHSLTSELEWHVQQHPNQESGSALVTYDGGYANLVQVTR
jgi:hypothetical protein